MTTDSEHTPTVEAAGGSPAWQPAVRDPDGVMSVAEPFRFEPDDPSRIGEIVGTFIGAAFAEARAWRAETDLTINPPPAPGTPLDFLTVDLDGRRAWHATNATFMAPSGRVSATAEGTLRSDGWQGVGTGGPVYKVWDDVPMSVVAAEVARCAVAVFDPAVHGYWEVSVNVLAPEDEAGTFYEVVAGATRAVAQRAVLEMLGAGVHDDDAWGAVCRALGLRPADVPRVATPVTPSTVDPDR